MGKLRAAPCEDALRVVADDHHVAMPDGEQVYNLGLQLVRVLILVNEDVLKLVCVKRGDVRLLHQQPLPVEQEVVVVHHVALALALHVGRIDALQLLT